MKTVTVLGSTGSVGTQTLDLLAGQRDRFAVVALVGGRNAVLLAEQARALGARFAVIADPAGHAALAEALSGSGIAVASGPAAVLEAASRAGGLDDGGDHRGRRAAGDARRDPARRGGGARQQGGAGLRRRR